MNVKNVKEVFFFLKKKGSKIYFFIFFLMHKANLMHKKKSE